MLLLLRGRGRTRRLHRERHRIRWQQRHLHAAGVFPPRDRRRQQLRVGGAFFPCLRLERRLPRRHLPAAGVLPPRFQRRLLRRHLPAATTSATSSRGGGTPAAVPAATTSAAVAISSRGGGIPAAFPAVEVTGGTHVSGSGVGPPAVVGAAPTPPASDPSVAAGTATGERLATGQKQLVTCGGRREGLAEVSRMAGVTSPAGPGASGPPDVVHDGGAGRRWQGKRVTPAGTGRGRSAMGYG